jgi:UDP-2,3-diacylglucosamine hydrolase
MITSFRMAKAFFVSDAHIGSPSDPAYKRLLSFVDHAGKESATYLFMMGDLFEFLHGHGGYIVKMYRELFDKLKKLSSKGTKIYYLYGNHDFNFDLPFDFIHCMELVDSIVIDGMKFHISHGDGLDPMDTKYRMLRSVVRSRLFDLLSKLTPDIILYRAAGICSNISRSTGVHKMVNENRFLCYRDHALRKLASTDLDVVVFGHTHVPDLSRVSLKNGKYKYYINPGYFGKNGTYGIIDGSTVYIGVFNDRVLLS